MKITICGSIKFAFKMVEVKQILEKMNLTVDIPIGTEEYASGEQKIENQAESLKNKIEHDAILEHYNKIVASDAILVVNEDKNGIKNYIGGNSFMEIGYAYILDKKIFLLNQVPEMLYTTEITAMKPIVLSGDLTKIN